MDLPLMPKATAVWLVENTTLTFEQIAEFCGLHQLEIQAIADGEVATGMQGLDPIANGQINKDEIRRCEKDSALRLQLHKSSVVIPEQRSKGPRYTPVAKRQDKPDAIAWLLRHHAELTDPQISRLIGTTKATISQVRDRTHWNMANLRPRSPVELGLCSYQDLFEVVKTAAVRSGKPAPTIEPAPAIEPTAVAEPAPVPEIEPPPG
jgi:uncharacterized protein